MLSTTSRLYIMLALAALATAPFSTQAVPQKLRLGQALRELHETSEFLNALESSGLLTQLESQTPWTLFVPVNKAFLALPTDIRYSRGTLVTLINYHTIAKNLTRNKLNEFRKIATAQGSKLSIAMPLINNSAKIIQTIPVQNGTVHIIDTALVPPVLKNIGKPVRIRR